MISLTIHSVEKTAEGRVIVRYGNGKHAEEYESVQHWRDATRARLDALDANSLRGIANALMATRQPNLNNVAAFAGKSVNIDFAVNNWGSIS